MRYQIIQKEKKGKYNEFPRGHFNANVVIKKCRIEEQFNIENKNSTPSDILDDQRLYPSDTIKLYNQERIMKQNTDKQDSATNQYTTMPLEETELLRNLTEKN